MFVKSLVTRCAWVLLVVVAAGCSKENLPFSSGALSGQATPAPESWVEVASADIIQLETMGEEPYSVNLWIIGKPAFSYVYAGDNYATWVEHLENNPAAKLGIDGKLYDVNATRVIDQAEFDQFAVDWDAKYGSERPQGSSVNDVWLYRLSAR